MRVTLESKDLAVTFTPSRGADIVSVVDRQTGIEVLAQSPTGQVSPRKGAFSHSMTNWIDGYPGGWQILIPNSGAEREHDGVVQGYHGEASLTTWDLQERTASSARLETLLVTAPLKLNRTIEVEAGTLVVTDTVTNLSPRTVSFRFLQHPALGHPFLDEHSYLLTEAHKVISDANAPGNLADKNVTGSPSLVLPEGPIQGSISLPGPHSGKSFFGALTDFVSKNEGSSLTEAVFVSPTQGFGISLQWDTSTFPHAWLWMEAHALEGWPWFQRLYSIAVEPSNVLPGEGFGPNGEQRGGVGTPLAGGQSLSTQTRMSRVSLPDSHQST